MAQLFPSMMPAELLKGYYGMQDVINQSEQGGLKSQLMNLDIAREQAAQKEMAAGAPLREQQRQLQLGDVQGQLARQPNVQAREAALARGGAEQAPAEVRARGLEMDLRQRVARSSQTALDMDQYAQAFGPVIEAAGSASGTGNYEAMNEAWESAFSTLDKLGHDTSKMRQTPRDKLLAQVGQKYNEAVNTAPALREQIKAHQAHLYKLEEEAERRKTLVDQARERATAAATREPTQLSAATSRSLEKYRKDPTTMTPQEQQLTRDYFENKMSDQDQVDYEWAFDAPTRNAIRQRHMERVKRTHPELYRNQQAIAETDAVKAHVEAKGIKYEPDKYEYRILQDGRVQRKAK